MAINITTDNLFRGVHIHRLKTENHHNNDCLPTDARVHIELRVKKVCRWLCQNYEGDSYILDESELETECDVILYRSIIFEAELELYNMLSDALGTLEVGDDNHAQIIDPIICYGQKVYDKMSMIDCNIIPVDILLVDTQTYDEREVLLRSMEDENSGMVPAKASAIKSLKRKRIEFEDEEEIQKCIVCLEEICRGENVTCMPCGHMFHEDCITTWLFTSHLCPICRYEMPRAN